MRFKLSNPVKNTIFVNAEKGGKAEIVGAEAGKPFEVDKGAKVTVKATPDKDYHFVGWYHSSNAETPVSTDAEYEFTVSGNYALTAKFEKDNVTPPVETKMLHLSTNRKSNGRRRNNI